MTCRYVLRRYVILPASRSPETVLFSNSYIGARHVMLVIYVTTNAVFPKTHANVIEFKALHQQRYWLPQKRAFDGERPGLDPQVSSFEQRAARILFDIER